MKFLKIYQPNGDVNYVRLEDVKEIFNYRIENLDYRSGIRVTGTDGLDVKYYSKHKPEDAIQQVVEV